MSDDEALPYEVGFKAGWNLDGLGACEHAPGTAEHRSWARGWTYGRRLRIGEDGDPEREQRLDQLRAEAVDDPVLAILGEPEPTLTPVAEWGDVSHLRKPDPAADILASAEPKVEAVLFIGRPLTEEEVAELLHRWQQVNGPALADAVHAFVEAIATWARESLTPIVEKLNEWARSLGLDGEPGDAQQQRQLERRRHGSAAVCPRHGPTKGGTCMKCQRGRR